MLFELKENAKWIGVGVGLLILILILPLKMRRMVGGFIMSIKNTVFPESVESDENLDDIVDNGTQYA